MTDPAGAPSLAQDRARRHHGRSVVLFFWASFAIGGLHVPYFSLFLDARGLSAAEIGVIAAVPMLARVFCTPAFTFLADRTGDRRLVLIWLCVASALALGSLLLASSFLALLAASTVFAVFWTSVIPMVEALAITGMQRHAIDYGRVRALGSLGFIAASLGGGFLIARSGPGAIVPAMVGLGVATVAAAIYLPRAASPSTEMPPARPRIEDALALLGSSRFLVLILATSAVQAAHGFLYIFGSLHWQRIGIDDGTIGMLWTIGVVVEVLLFTFSTRAMRRFGAARLIAFAAAMSVVRWGVTGFDPPVPVLFALQAMHGLTFGAAHLGAMHFLASAVPPRLGATAQGIYSAMTAGIAMGLVMAASGPLYDFAAGGAYWAMAGLAGLGFLAAVALDRFKA